MLYTNLDLNQQYKIEIAFDAGADWQIAGYLLKLRGQAAIVRLESLETNYNLSN